MNVLVAGGTGLNGRAIVEAMLDAGHNVGVLGRSAAGIEDRFGSRVTAVEANVTDPATLEGKLQPFDVLVDAVQFPNAPIENPKKGWTFREIDRDGTKNLVDAARSQGIDHFIDISGAGADPNARYHWFRHKWEEEEHLRASGLPYTIFRPSWIYGPEDVSLNRFLGFAKWLPFVPVIGNGAKMRVNPLFVDDVGKHVAACVQNEATVNRIFGIGGPQVLTMNEVIRTALRVQGKRRLLLPQPTWLMKPVAAVIQHAPNRPLTPDAIDFITNDAVVDTTELQETFHLPLTPLEDALRTYLKD